MILIAGDSWGCGEWGSRAEVDDRHPGLSAFFKDDGKQVINLSVGGACNLDIASVVSNFLDNNAELIPAVDRILVFQSNWNRDWRRHHDFDIGADLAQPYPQLVGRFIERFYTKLNQSACKHKKQIEIIGGCGDTLWFDNITLDYSNLKIVCQSMINLLINQSHRIETAVHSLWLNNAISLEFIAYCKLKLSPKNLDLLLQDIDLGLQRQNLMKQNNKYFVDDWVHANPEGYKLLYQLINVQ
jgi:hypothetical protein